MPVAFEVSYDPVFFLVMPSFGHRFILASTLEFEGNSQTVMGTVFIFGIHVLFSNIEAHFITLTFALASMTAL